MELQPRNPQMDKSKGGVIEMKFGRTIDGAGLIHLAPGGPLEPIKKKVLADLAEDIVDFFLSHKDETFLVKYTERERTERVMGDNRTKTDIYFEVYPLVESVKGE